MKSIETVSLALVLTHYITISRWSKHIKRIWYGFYCNSNPPNMHLSFFKSKEHFTIQGKAFITTLYWCLSKSSVHTKHTTLMVHYVQSNSIGTLLHTWWYLLHSADNMVNTFPSWNRGGLQNWLEVSDDHAKMWIQILAGGQQGAWRGTGWLHADITLSNLNGHLGLRHYKHKVHVYSAQGNDVNGLKNTSPRNVNYGMHYSAWISEAFLSAMN